MTEVSDLDLTPEEPNRALKPKSPLSSPRNWIIVILLFSAAGFIVYQALGNAVVYYKNVDEAVAEKADLADSTFRMQGVISSEPLTTKSGLIVFQISFGGADVEVRHSGPEPSDLFEQGERCVVEGKWQGDIFISKQIIIKHDESYSEQNPDRLNYDTDTEAVLSGKGRDL